MHVFLVEDDASVAGLIIGRLELRKHEVTWVGNLRDANYTFVQKKRDIDVAVVDLQLPDGEGTTFVAVVPTGLPCCMYTGLPYDAERKLAAMGITDVPCFSKGDPMSMLDWLEEQDKSDG